MDTTTANETGADIMLPPKDIMVVSLVRSTKLGTFAMGKPPRINDSRPSCRRGGCVGKFSHMTCPGIWVGATCLGEHGPMPSIFVVFVLYLMRPMFWLTSRAIASIGVFSRNEYNNTDLQTGQMRIPWRTLNRCWHSVIHTPTHAETLVRCHCKSHVVLGCTAGPLLSS